ncbi:MAG TPA: arabinofuranosidase catalytic domain-containing protein [Polyangiaceae bacterium]|nr:arabinofuranosidase catalytic domain-containing protein [Polyangiaceae bacterium]
MRLQYPILAVTVALGTIAGCSTSPSTPSGTGGSTNTGGSTGNSTGGSTGGSVGPTTGGTVGTGGSVGTTGGSGGGSCPGATPCGGDVVNSWTISSSCLSVSGVLDLASLGLGCKAGTISGSMSVTGTWSAKSDTSYQDGSKTTGTLNIGLPAECLFISGTTTDCPGISGPLKGIGLADATCTPAAGGGCSCVGKVDQSGSLGWPNSAPDKSGNWETANNVVTIDSKAKFSYCVSGNTMTWTPTAWIAPVSGTITFQKAGTTGTGGTSSTGGGTSTGGATGTGGSDGGGKSTGGTTNTGGSGGGGGGGKSGGGATSTGGSGGGGGKSSTGGATSTGGSSGTRTDGPCDIYAGANTPCVAAYSTIRALSKAYTGPLYQVRNGSSAMNTGSGGMLKDIPMTADGFADTSVQDAHCMGSVCTISLLYDQSGKGNNLKVAPKGLSNGGTYAASDDFESSATKGSMMVAGHKVYSLYMAAREGYRLTSKGAGMPLGNTPEGIYMLADGTHSGTACCWDFGNVSTDPTKYGVMNTLFFGVGYWGKGAGSGPWFLGDFEGGVWAGGSGGSNVTNNNSPSLKVPFAFGILKTSSGQYALRMADMATANDLTTAYDGASPKTWNNEGGILIGIGGDNSNNSWGTFYEGAITAGRPTNDTDLNVFKNVKAVGYGK